MLAWTQQRSALGLGLEQQTTIGTGAGVELETWLIAGLSSGIGGGVDIPDKHPSFFTNPHVPN